VLEVVVLDHLLPRLSNLQALHATRPAGFAAYERDADGAVAAPLAHHRWP
jgi:hypothetical protein